MRLRPKFFKTSYFVSILQFCACGSIILFRFPFFSREITSRDKFGNQYCRHKLWNSSFNQKKVLFVIFIFLFYLKYENSRNELSFTSYSFTRNLQFTTSTSYKTEACMGWRLKPADCESIALSNILFFFFLLLKSHC